MKTNVKWVELIRHATGATTRKKRDHGYRNQFCVQANNLGEWPAMVEAGLASQGCVINEGRSVYFHATREGCEYAGLHEAAINRALSD